MTCLYLVCLPRATSLSINARIAVRCVFMAIMMTMSGARCSDPVLIERTTDWSNKLSIK